MRYSIVSIFVFAVIFHSTVLPQSEPILTAQAAAIRNMATRQGFSPAQLNTYIEQQYGIPLGQLTRDQAAGVIRAFQSDNPPRPSVVAVPPTAPFQRGAAAEPPGPVPVPGQPPVLGEPILAEFLEVGMSKRFHLVDGNILQGIIVRVEDGLCHIETIDGLLRVPSDSILEERAAITKRDGTHYVGPVLRETMEEIILRSTYGDVVVSKRDIEEMDRYHGGRLVPWVEERRTFHAGEAVLTDIFMDPTPFPLRPNTFYISGLSLGYGFTERFMVRSTFGSDFMGDLNVHPLLRFYHRQTGTSEMAAALGFRMYNHHPMAPEVARYAQYVTLGKDGPKFPDYTPEPELEEKLRVSDIISKDTDFYWEMYLVLGSRRSLPSGRGKVGWHVGVKTNSLAINQPKLESDWVWDKKSMILPYRVWVAFEYDLSKKLKLMAEMWADNGHRFRTITQAFEDYLGDDTAFILDATTGDYRPVDFDFGFLYAVTETFRLGIHFQEPFLVFYWEFYQF